MARKRYQYSLWTGEIQKSPGGLTKKDVVRKRQPDGTYRYAYKSRVEHGKRIYALPQVGSSFKRMQFK